MANIDYLNPKELDRTMRYSWGGNIYGNGGSTKPDNTIYVNDPSDPRLKLYSDSLFLYRQNNKQWSYPGSVDVTKKEFDTKAQEQSTWPNYLFDDDLFLKDKKANKVKAFKEYVNKIYPGKDAFKGDKKAEDAYNRNIGKDYMDSKEPIVEKNKDGTENYYYQYYKGKIDKSYFTNFDPVTKTSREYVDDDGLGNKTTLLNISNPYIKPIDVKYKALKEKENIGGITLSESIKKSTNGITDFEKHSKDDYKEYTWGTSISNIYKKPKWEVIYNPKKYNASDPKLDILTNSINKNFKNNLPVSKPEPKMVSPTLEEDIKPRMVQGTMEQDIKPKYWEDEYTSNYGNPNIGKGRIKYGNGEVKEYGNGGKVGIYNIPKGLTHEQHPWGGYPVTSNDLVEGGEVVIDKPDGSKYIFSNRLNYK